MSLDQTIAFRIEPGFNFVAIYQYFYSDKTEQHFFDDFPSVQKWLEDNHYVREYSIFKIANSAPLWMTSGTRPQPAIAQEQSRILV